MPFRSKAQLRTCYGGGIKKMNKKDCDKWLKETKSVCCLPERVGLPSSTRCQRKEERVKGKVKTGPRGGKYFEIKEGDCKVKVYLKK